MTPPVLRLIVTVACVSSLLTGSAVAPTRAAGTVKAHLVEAYGKLPLSFEANRGQTDSRVKFLSRGSGYTLFLTQREAVLAMRPAPARGTRPGASGGEDATPSVLRMHLLGANPAAPLSGLDTLPGTVNYFVGHDPAKWQTHVPTFAKVKQSQVYPGVDLVYYGNQRQVEFDFLVTPGTDPTAIRLSFQGADELKVDEQGNLLLRVNGGEVRLATPHVYQEVQGKQQRVAARYIVEESQNREPRTANSAPVRVGFQVAAYDQSRPLVIDPTLVYSTYLGGSGFDEGFSIAVDAAGAAYVTGDTLSADFTAGCTAPCIVLDRTHNGQLDAFVTKLDPTGTALLYATYLGGSGFDQGLSIAVDAAGAAYVTGNTDSANFTAGCMAPCTALDRTLAGMVDAFVAKISHIGVPATLTVTPATATALVNTQHCVSATVEDALGNPTPAITVQFSVTGSVTTSGTATTDTNGQATFCYTGPLFPGTDTITAYADPNTNNTQDADEPSDGATQAWVLPPTTVTINQAAGQADPTSTAPITFTAVFSESVSGFTGSDVVIGGTAGGTKTVDVTGGPSTYTVAVSGLTTGGTVIATIPAGGATDAAGNGNTASTSTDNTVTFDPTPPTVTINQAAGQADPTSTAPITFTAVFSESVSGFTGSDVVIGGTAGGTKTVDVTGGPSTYTVAVSGLTTGGTVIATIPAGGATDAAGNGNTASTSTDNTVTLTP